MSRKQPLRRSALPIFFACVSCSQGTESPAPVEPMIPVAPAAEATQVVPEAPQVAPEAPAVVPDPPMAVAEVPAETPPVVPKAPAVPDPPTAVVVPEAPPAVTEEPPEGKPGAPPEGNGVDAPSDDPGSAPIEGAQGEPGSRPTGESEPAAPGIAPLPDGTPIPTLLATRGEMMLDDDCTEDRKRGLGYWSLTEPGTCKVEHDVVRKPLHVPVANFGLPSYRNVIVQITFRWGEPMGGQYSQQFLAIVPDQKPARGHKLEAWTTGTGRGDPGLSVRSSNAGGGLVAEKPYDGFAANTWHTAVLEVVDDEALFRVNDQVAYGQKPFVAGPKNKINLFLGTSVIEFRGIRAWHASANPQWQAIKDEVLR